MKFILNSSIDTLATRANLYQWGKATTNKCHLCSEKETTNHILNSCKASLEQGRYTFRHDSVLRYIVDCIDTNRLQAYCDIKGCSTGPGGTIPPNILVTNQRPDLVIIDKEQKAVWIYELTCPFETRIEEAHKMKSHKYDHVLLDIEERGYQVFYQAFEVGARGQVTKENKKRLKDIYNHCQTSHSFSTFVKNISVISVLGSFAIFTARREKQWVNNPDNYIKPIFT